MLTALLAYLYWQSCSFRTLLRPQVLGPSCMLHFSLCVYL